MVPYNQLKSHQLPPFIKLRNPDGTETVHYSIFYDGDVPDEFKKKAQTELNETEEKKRKGLERLREVLKEECMPVMDEQTLLCTLRKCKYNMNKAEKQIVKLAGTRNMLIEMLKEADMKRLEDVLDHMVVGFLPYRDRKGRAIFFTTPNINFERFSMLDCLLCYYVVLSSLISNPMTSITGVIYIGEAKTPAIDVIYQSMKAFRKHLDHILAFPARTATIEVLNEIFIVRWTVNLIKPILTAKSIERINFYGSDVRKMRKNYHPDLLPEEFGGTMGPLSNTFYKDELLNFIKRLKNG